MCRWLAYSGTPIKLEELLVKRDRSLIDQSLHARQGATTTNGDGFGVGWYEDGEGPRVYRSTHPAWNDRNLRELAAGISSPLFFAHIRASTGTAIQETNTHPFRYGRWLWMHNGLVRDFQLVKRQLQQAVDDAFFDSIEGTTDSEWIYALVLSQLADPFGVPEPDELAGAAVSTLRLLREVRGRHGIDTSSPVNLCLTTGHALIATRFSFDYGWYPDEDELLETDLPYVSLWYTVGGEYVERDGESAMTASDTPRSLLVASEPLTVDTSTWLEVPEYSMITAVRTAAGLDFETLDLDV